ncbi:C6 zinc finger domain protein [Phlyctema vagabunda]|uniref:C6 zinc finger domain protein n=1 Tax=Phlyctema vagabunda TaxID=108571 RepID=A0ABR4PHJ7_9HELO
MIPRDIRRVFSRLDLQAMSFADSAAPYRYASSSTSSESFMRLLDPPGAWEDVDEAMDYLIHNFRWIFHTAARFEPDPVPLLVLAEAEAKSRVWEVRFSSLLDRMHIENVQDQKVKYTITLLRVYQITMGIILGTRIYGHEELHDSYTAEYTRVVTMIESMLPPSSEIRTGIEKGGEEEQIFSFEPGLIFVLFFTAIKCRIPDLRRRAIALLGPPSPSGHSSASSPLLLPHARKARYQEGAWESQAAAAVASFVINIEEENCSSGDDGARTVPLESDRIHVVNVASCILRRQVQVCCVFLTPGQGQGYRVREGVVNY